MRKLFIILILLFTINVSFADIDSLVEEYIIKIENGNFNEEDLTEYLDSHDNTSVYKALGAFLQARQHLYRDEYNDAYKELEYALMLLKSEDNTKLRIEVLYYLSEIDQFFGNWPSVILRSSELRKLSEENEDIEKLVEANYNLAFSYLLSYDSEEANRLAVDGLELSELYDYQNGISGYYNFASVFELFKGNFLEAKNHLYKSIDFLDETSKGYIIDKPLIRAKVNLISLNYQMRNAEEAFEMFDQLIESKELTNTYYLGLLYTLRGDYLYAVDVEEAIKYYKFAYDNYKMTQTIKNSAPSDLATAEALASLYFLKDRFEESAKLFNEVYKSQKILYNYDDALLATEELENVKYDEVYERVSLLEQLNESKNKEVETRNKMLLISFSSIVILLIACLFIIKEIKLKNKTERKLYQASITDGLTNLYNRKKIFEIFESNLKENNAIILLDIDDFKVINDTFGHPVGDEVIKTVSGVLKDSVRSGDKVGRYGGEEFMIFLEDASNEELERISERIRVNIQDYKWDKEKIKTTVSIGVTKCFSEDSEEILHRVDELLYKAKRNGKNQIAIN